MPVVVFALRRRHQRHGDRLGPDAARTGMPEVEEVGGRIPEVGRRHALQYRLACRRRSEAAVLGHGPGHGDHHRMGQTISQPCRRRPNLVMFVDHGSHPKNANSLCSPVSTVGTSTARSRYLLPRSHDVSGANRQAWHEAACSVVPSR